MPEGACSTQARDVRYRTGRWLLAGVLASAALAALVPPLAAARTGDALREGVRNGTSTRETEIVGRINATTAPKGGYVTRQSNVQTGANAGGGAIYGCRTPVGGTAAGTAPCLRASNQAGGFAFEFATSAGTAGFFSVGDPAVSNPAAKPFTTNATGVATGLNADQLDGFEASQLNGEPGPPNGPAGGDLTGTYPNPDLAAALDLLIPIAVVNVTAAGTLNTERHRAPVTGPPVVTKSGVGIYDVDLPGVQFFFSDDAASCTAIGSDPRFVSASSIGGDDLRVFTHSDAGALTDTGFYCTIYNLTN